MTGWHYLLASIEAVLLAVLVALWYDVLRDRPGWTMRRATLTAAKAAIAVPIGFVVVLVLPVWVGVVAVAIPAIAVATMAMVS